MELKSHCRERFEPAVDAIRQLLEEKKGSDEPLLAAIDGRCGSGKTTLGEYLKQIFDCNLFRMDDFFLRMEQRTPERLREVGGNVDYERFEETVLRPLLQKEQRMNEICDSLGTASPEEMDTLMEELGTIQDTLTMHDFYVIDAKVEEVARALGLLDIGLERDVTDLSGGQRTKVLLGKLLLEKPDILLLDEPTNHLDITSKEILENAIRNYTGTVLYVSHDRYFINQTATRIIELRDKQLTSYIGNYDYYETHRTYSTDSGSPFTPISGVSDAPAQTAPAVSQAKLSWQESKAEAARQRKKANDLKKLEASIEELENRIAEIDEQFLLPENATNVGLLNDLTKQRNEADTELNELYTKWEELSEED